MESAALERSRLLLTEESLTDLISIWFLPYKGGYQTFGSVFQISFVYFNPCHI